VRIDRELIVTLLEHAIGGIGTFGTLLAVLGTGKPWLATACEWLLVALVTCIAFDIAYHLFPIGITWLTIRRGVVRLTKQFSERGFAPDLVIGAGRAGSIIGAMIAGNLGHRPFIAVDVQHHHNGARKVTVDGPLRLETTNLDSQRILVTFAYLKTSETADSVKKYLQDMGLKADLISYATLFEDPDAPKPHFARNYYSAFQRRIQKKGWGALPWSITDRYDYR